MLIATPSQTTVAVSPRRPQWRARFIGVLLTLLPVAAAHAHAFVISSVPSVEAELDGAAVGIDLQFNSRIDRARARLVLISPGDTRRELAIAADERPDHLRTAAGALAAGAYRVEWYVLSPDGHVTRGYVPFHVRAK